MKEKTLNLNNQRRRTGLRPIQRQSMLLFLLLFFFGLVVSSHVQTIRANNASSDLNVRYRQRQEDLKRYEEQHSKLLEENLLLNQRKEEAIAELLQREGQEDVLQELQSIRLLAGFTEVSGPGIELKLDDKPGYDIFTDSEDSIVHDGDIRHALDLLRNAGAAAFSVNNERIVNTSYIFCIGPTILCNSQRLTPPYIIRAIGDPSILKEAIETDQMFAIRKTPGIDLIVEVTVSDQVLLPPFADAGNIQQYIDRLEVVSQ